MTSKSDVVLIVDGAVEHELKLGFSDLAAFIGTPFFIWVLAVSHKAWR